MPDVICIACGAEKPFIAEPCPRCAYSPLGDPVALAKATYLSINRFEDFDERTRYSQELAAIGQRLARHQPFEYDPAELQRLAKLVEAFQSVTRGQVYGTLFRVFLPAFYLLGGVAALWAVLRLFLRK